MRFYFTDEVHQLVRFSLGKQNVFVWSQYIYMIFSIIEGLELVSKRIQRGKNLYIYHGPKRFIRKGISGGLASRLLVFGFCISSTFLCVRVMMNVATKLPKGT